jgi:hypothetical protein
MSWVTKLALYKYAVFSDYLPLKRTLVCYSFHQLISSIISEYRGFLSTRSVQNNYDLTMSQTNSFRSDLAQSKTAYLCQNITNCSPPSSQHLSHSPIDYTSFIFFTKASRTVQADTSHNISNSRGTSSTLLFRCQENRRARRDCHK